jgi:REP element-mobilizing transposase RayT
MHHQILLHVVWTTRHRGAHIDAARAAMLAADLPRIAREERCELLALGIVTTHLHLIVRCHPTINLPRLLQRMKGGTAHHINGGHAARSHHLRWAKGYSVTSISPRNLAIAMRYVDAQTIHHPTEAIPGWPAGSPG